MYKLQFFFLFLLFLADEKRKRHYLQKLVSVKRMIHVTFVKFYVKSKTPYERQSSMQGERRAQ